VHSRLDAFRSVRFASPDIFLAFDSSTAKKSLATNDDLFEEVLGSRQFAARSVSVSPSGDVYRANTALGAPHGQVGLCHFLRSPNWKEHAPVR
jgi:hypothetical protein